jgi:hypothetical protein
MAKHLGTAAVVAVAFLSGLAVGRPWFQQVRFVACSPDGVFRLEAVKTEWTPLAMPGHGGGYVRLINNYSRRVIRESPYLTQVSSFFHTSYTWHELEVMVKLDARDTTTESWPLRRD